MGPRVTFRPRSDQRREQPSSAHRSIPLCSLSLSLAVVLAVLRPAPAPRTLSPALPATMPGFRAVGDTVGPGYARRGFAMRGYLRQSANTELSRLSGVPDSKMRWEALEYVLYVYLRLRVKLVGWPADLVFTNLSNRALTGLGCLARLVALWDSGVLHLARVTDAEYGAALADPRACAPGPLHRGFREDFGRSDMGKRKHRPKTDPLGERRGRYVREGPKSARVVSEEMELWAEGPGGELSEDPISEFEEGSSSRPGRGSGEELEEDPIEEW